MAGTEPKHRDWVKLWVKESLIGTIREDLTPEERGTWYDFLLLAGNSRIPGVICANETTALPVKRIAGILNIDVTLVKRCIKKFKESGRITVDKNGVMSIFNWSKYQYTDYDRQKPYREAKADKELSEVEEELARQEAHQDKVSKMSSKELQADAERLGAEWDEAHASDPTFDKDGEPRVE
ncbi:hypothetical protein LCGC14_1111140 [marine sediment metagenome]|uniref:Phage replisome organiser N-terminal domain-containing protein n=1 Tax=marine sediment metagenome TaxID=412755 RepID=A0A0F9MUK6_9ZZZZ